MTDNKKMEKIKCSIAVEEIEKYFENLFNETDLETLDGFYIDEFVQTQTGKILNILHKEVELQLHQANARVELQKAFNKTLNNENTSLKKQIEELEKIINWVLAGEEISDEISLFDNVKEAIWARNDEIYIAKTEKQELIDKISELEAKIKKPLGYGNEASFVLDCMRDEISDLKTENTSLREMLEKINNKNYFLNSLEYNKHNKKDLYTELRLALHIAKQALEVGK